ncbi:MAG: GTPase [Planctomycetes bacterium]|nr:GTPase [Planctomycetota bacterium]
MVQINFAQRQVNAKIVYYGPGMSGKTTNLEIVHQRAPAPNRGDLTSISTDGDRTLFFDFMPLDLGTVAGMRTCFQIYTVPGQVYYNSTRKLVLQGVDGVVFVADSSASMIEENLESMRNLEQNLAEYGKSLAQIPLIIQYNKRDLPDAMSLDDLNAALNPHNAPFFEAIANTGQGVFPTLKALAARVLESIHTGAKSSGASTPTLLQTGFHPAPAAAQPAAPAAAAQRTLQQTGFHPAPTPQITKQGARPGTPQPIAAAGGMPPLPNLPGTPQRKLQQTGFHPAPAAQPQAQAPGFGYGGPQAMQAPAQVAQQQAAQQQSSGLHMMRPDRGNAPAATPTARPRPTAAPAAGTAPRRATKPEGSPRIQPRAAPLPTPTGGKKRLVYVGIFVAVALGIGAVVAKIVLKVF